METIINFVQHNKVSFLMTIATALPAIYFIIISFLELSRRVHYPGGNLFDGRSPWLQVIVPVLMILLCSLLVFRFFGMGIKWLFVLMIFVAPIMYFVSVFIASWVLLFLGIFGIGW